MKIIMTLLIIVFWLGALYYGYTLIVTKTISSAPEKRKSLDEARHEKDQRQKAHENLQKKKLLMEDRERALRYHQNR